MDNRDLYLAVAALVKRHARSARSLEDYLRALRAGLLPHFGVAGLAPERFADILDGAFTAPVPPRDPSWRASDLSHPDGAPRDGPYVDRILKSQVLDLEDAAASGALADELRFFGRSVGRAEGPPRATYERWFNWTASDYLECGIAGALGGWEPGDGTGRELVPGDVAVLGDHGFVTVPAEEIERPVLDLPELSWRQVCEFLWAGQQYE